MLGLSVSSSRYVFTCAFLREEADTRMFAHTQEAAKRANKKISSRTVGTDVGVLVVPVVVQPRVDELWRWQKSLAMVGMKSNFLACFIHSQGAIKHLLSLVVETVDELSSCN